MKPLNILYAKDNYKVYIEENMNNFYYLLQESKISNDDKIFLITDDNLYSIYRDLIDEFKDNLNCKVYYFKQGEESKNISTIQSIYDFLIENNANRNSSLIAFGGGVVGDLVGFVAATFMRGIKFVSIPTTLLSQVDSSVGGKVGFDYKGLKNIIGSFYNPVFVYICTDFLNTLKDAQFKDGLGEVIKYGMIQDSKLFEFIDKNYKSIIDKKTETLLFIIKSCLSIKLEVVEKDFKDLGLRNMLNFGHTIGHGIEISSNFKVSHGAAVALGMLVAVKLSEKKLSISKDVYIRLKALLKKLELPTSYKVDNYSLFLYAINHDKKNTNEIKFVLLEDISKCKIKVEVTTEEICSAMEESINRR